MKRFSAAMSVVIISAIVWLLFFAIVFVHASPGPSVTLTWTGQTAVGVSYNVYRSTTGVYTTVLNPVPVLGLSYVDSSVQYGTTYTYVVRTTANGLESASSNEVKVIFPVAAPTNLSATVTP